MHLTTKPDGKGLRRSGIAMVSVVAVALVGLVGVSSAAQAAELTPSITNMKVTMGYDPEGTGTEVSPDTEISTSTMLTFHADWTVPGQSNDGDTFTVPVPTPFRIASSEPFNLLQNGATIATCQYSTPDEGIVCTIVGGPHADAEGSIWFTGRLDPPTDPGETPVWDVGGDVTVLPIPYTPPPGAYTPPFGTMKQASWAEIRNGKAEVRWNVYMWPGCEDSSNTCVKEFEVTDTLVTTNPAMPHSLRETSFVLERWERAQNPDGTWASGDGVDTGVSGSAVTLAKYVDGVWTVDSAVSEGEIVGEPTVAADGKSFTFTLDEAKVPYQYRLYYFSEADGAISLDGELYQNVVTVNGEPKEAQATPRVQGGGGANAGSYTSFVASKQLVNDTTVDLPEEYVLTATQGNQTETITVPADGSQINSPYFPASNGSITICESLPSVDGVIWQPYTITGTGVTGPDANGCYTLAPAGGQRIEIVANNRATPAAGTFSVTKALEADRYVSDLVGDTTFTVEYTVNGEAQTPLEVQAGATVTSPEFPADAQVELTEVKPDVFGVVWGEEVFSESSFRIDAGGNIEVQLTNPATPATVSVGDYTWIDADRDGVQDDGEPALAGVELTLIGPDGGEVEDVTGNAVAPQTSDANGKYLFENLPPLEAGTYTVKVTGVPDGYFQTALETGDDRSKDSSGDQSVSHLPLGQDGDSDLTLDFGFVTYDPEIDIVKTDIDGNDANDKKTAVDLTPTGGKTTLRFVVTNTGNEPLTDVELTDVISGSGKVDSVSCEFPDGSTGTTWGGPLDPGAQIICTAKLSGVEAGTEHRDEATVTATGVFTGKSVLDDDPYHAKVDEETTQPPAEKLSTTGFAFLPYSIAGAMLLTAGLLTLTSVRRREVEACS